MGRHRIEITPEQIETIEKLAGYGLTEAAIAHCIGLNPKTFYPTRKRLDR